MTNEERKILETITSPFNVNDVVVAWGRSADYVRPRLEESELPRKFGRLNVKGTRPGKGRKEGLYFALDPKDLERVFSRSEALDVLRKLPQPFTLQQAIDVLPVSYRGASALCEGLPSRIGALRDRERRVKGRVIAARNSAARYYAFDPKDLERVAPDDSENPNERFVGRLERLAGEYYRRAFSNAEARRAIGCSPHLISSGYDENRLFIRRYGYERRPNGSWRRTSFYAFKDSPEGVKDLERALRTPRYGESFSSVRLGEGAYREYLHRRFETSKRFSLTAVKKRLHLDANAAKRFLATPRAAHYVAQNAEKFDFKNAGGWTPELARETALAALRDAMPSGVFSAERFANENNISEYSARRILDWLRVPRRIVESGELLFAAAPLDGDPREEPSDCRLTLEELVRLIPDPNDPVPFDEIDESPQLFGEELERYLEMVAMRKQGLFFDAELGYVPNERRRRRGHWSASQLRSNL